MENTSSTQKLNIALIDDDSLCIAELKHLLSGFPFVHIAGESTGAENFQTLLEDNSVDLLFLDICLKESTGFSVAAYLKKHFPDVMVVFVTGFENFAIDGYEYEPLDFLAKPVSLSKLTRVLNHALEKKRQRTFSSDARVGIQLSSGFRFVDVNSILFIERSSRKVQMVCFEENHCTTYLLRESISDLEKILGLYDFLRVHQSYLVSVRQIEELTTSGIGSTYELHLKHYSGKIPVSRSKYRELCQFFSELQIPVL